MDDRHEHGQSMKVVGRKKRASGLQAAAALQHTMIQLRGNKPFLPKGVHRFETFKKAQEWSLKMMTRPSKAARRS
jgi:hypothetical protein